jgi:iron-sulfur cluster assembly protein
MPLPFMERSTAMLAVSPAATAAIDKALEGTLVPDGAGLRLAAGGQTERGVAIEIAFVTAADPEDQVIETGAPADVFVEPGTAELLDDQVLDAQVQEDGAISFMLHAQTSGPNGASPGAG